MNTTGHDPDATGAGEAPRCERLGLGRKARLGIAAAGLIGLGALLGGLATMSLGAAAHGFGAGRHGPLDEAHAIERARDRAAWMLGRVDATGEQEQRIDDILVALVEDMQPLRERHHANRRELLAELLRSAPDSERLERLRRDELELADAASARVLAAVVQASAVLTPEQRAELVEHVARRH